MAEVTVIFGCMFSGKSSLLLDIIREYKVLGRRILALSHIRDNRYCTDSISTHNRVMYPCTKVDSLAFLRDTDLSQTDLLVIEEGQFFEDIHQVVQEIADTYMNLRIVIATLDLDFNRDPWKSVENLILSANIKIHTTAICKDCNINARTASYTHLKDKSGVVTGAETGNVIVGSDDLYEALCRKHYLEKNVPPKNELEGTQ